ncbi:MAG: SPASM domain-containing protein [Tannerella sp.]|nr:SPASM domain-containing protein [Tannerella sp.]
MSQDSFALLPDGTVSSCFEACTKDSPFGHIFFYGQHDGKGGYRYDADRLNLLRRQAVQYRDHCSECFAKWTCAGDCFHKTLVLNGGSTEFHGSGRCHINRELTKDQILEKIREAGGLCWHELPDHLREEAYAALREKEGKTA